LASKAYTALQGQWTGTGFNATVSPDPSQPGALTTTWGGSGVPGAHQIMFSGVQAGSGSLELTYNFAVNPNTITVDLMGDGVLQATRVVPPTTPPASPVTTGRQILTPATVPSAVDECTQQLTFGADGSVGPISCPNGDLNVLAWQQIAAGNPLVMTLGPYATPSQVQEALCADMHNSTGPIATSAYQISALYYGWKFGVDPSSVLLSGGCPAS
jgi:hypothetical protein